MSRIFNSPLARGSSSEALPEAKTWYDFHSPLVRRSSPACRVRLCTRRQASIPRLHGVLHPLANLSNAFLCNFHSPLARGSPLSTTTVQIDSYNFHSPLARGSQPEAGGHDWAGKLLPFPAFAGIITADGQGAHCRNKHPSPARAGIITPLGLISSSKRVCFHSPLARGSPHKQSALTSTSDLFHPPLTRGSLRRPLQKGRPRSALPSPARAGIITVHKNSTQFDRASSIPRSRGDHYLPPLAHAVRSETFHPPLARGLLRRRSSAHPRQGFLPSPARAGIITC